MAQMMKILIPPTWDELMENPVYAAYVRKRPRLPDNIAHGEPWMIAAHRVSGSQRPSWATKRVADYVTAYRRVDALLDSGEFDDAAIISLRKLWIPPQGFFWKRDKFAWCGRCRRPTLYRNVTKHHALGREPVLATEDGLRCYYCGAREIFAGRAKPRRRLA